MRKISALFGSYNFELGVDLRESITMCDLGDIFVDFAGRDPPMRWAARVAFAFTGISG
jgi:hypothetical protein